MSCSRDFSGALALSLLALSLASSVAADDRRGPSRPGREPLRFSLMGDVPHRDPDILKLDEVIREINGSGVDFTVHTGDIKGGSATCADELLQARWVEVQVDARTPQVFRVIPHTMEAYGFSF